MPVPSKHLFRYVQLARVSLVLLFALFDATPGYSQADDGLLENEQHAFLQAAESAADCVVQIESFGGLERVEGELVAAGPTSGNHCRHRRMDCLLSLCVSISTGFHPGDSSQWRTNASSNCRPRL